ncbi:MAG TPA: glycoside hydrolase family 13 protein [Acidimicrobiia bacterium]|nr:glycoside hydrolase family 13 protein [Acidimicrobiia bacterium]
MSQTYPWWRHAAVYQVYIRSFKDGNADGTGDIAGLASKLGYLRDLGVDAVWINPWYVSPLLDGGYDVADYRQIDPRFGTLKEAEAFIATAAEFGIRILVDLVPNHSSWEHRWFKEALTAGPASPERDRYHFAPGRGPDGSEPPSDWQAVFGGSAWEQVDDGEWYLHLFDISQPDFNWQNPEVRSHMQDVLRFWLDRGAAGFRVDVAHSLAKDHSYPDIGESGEELLEATELSNHPHWDRDELHEIVREWRKVLDEYPDAMMVAEAWVVNWQRQAKYVRADEYHQSFDFHFLTSPWDAEAMRTAITTSLDGAQSVGSVPTWVLSNHDVVRHATRYGLPKDVVAKVWLLDGDRSLLDAAAGLRRARAAVLLMLALPGSVYLYQGEELGLGEVDDLPLEVVDDPVWVRSGHTEKGRDGCRVPIPWESDGPSFGFGDNGSWLPQPDWFAEFSVAREEGDPTSMLELYRSALRLRREHFVDDEVLVWLDMGTGVIAFRRGSGVECIVNFGPEAVRLPDSDVLLTSAPVFDSLLPPDSAAWVRVLSE